jgi:transcriptional/translational regulatory protein YebC/TACO1
LEFELIDLGVDELAEDEGEILIYGEFAQNSNIQKYLEENGFEITSSEFVRIPNDLKDLTAEQAEQVNKLIEKIEEDEDVQNVFHNMQEE